MSAGPVDSLVYELDTRDFLEMERALGAWSHRYRQVGQGKFHGSLLHTQSASLGIFRNLWRQSIHCAGKPPNGTVAIGITLAQTGEPRWMGHRVSIDDLLVQRFNTIADYFSGSLSDRVVFTIPEVELATEIRLRTDADPEVFLNCSVVRLEPVVAARLRQACLQYLEMASSYLAAKSQGSMLPRAAQHLFEQLVQALVAARRARGQRRALAEQPFWLIRKAEDYSSGTTDRPLRIGEVCREVGVSERTLREAFHRMTGMSPHAYLKTAQLNRVYRTLRLADPTEVLVKQVAIANGFFHFGQFSRDYKRLFGELPSETLGRGPFDERTRIDPARRACLSAPGRTDLPGTFGNHARIG